MRGSAALRTGVTPGGALAGPWVQNSLWTAARAVPSLDLRFAENKSLVDATTGASLVTFTRASSGTFVGSDGVLRTAVTDAPRFDHNPTTGESLGLLVEEQRTNLCLYSQAISTAPWAANGTETCVASTITDPAGALNAFKINLGVVTFERWQQPITVVNGTTYTLSAWVRSTTGTALFRLRFAGGVTSSDLTATTTWQRFSFTLTAGTTSGFFAFNSPSTGTATEIHVWGAQLEAGAFPTSYIPTTSATATRAADVASITGTNFSSWYRQDEGTVFANTSVSAVAPATALQTQYAIHSGSADNRITVYKRANADTSTRLDITAATVSSAFINAGTFGLNNLTAAAVQINNFAVSLNGLPAVVDTAGNVPSVNQINLGSYVGATGFLNGTIRRLTYWPTRLSNEVLQRISQ